LVSMKLLEFGQLRLLRLIRFLYANNTCLREFCASTFRFDNGAFTIAFVIGLQLGERRLISDLEFS
jgi:hypothetical protein